MTSLPARSPRRYLQDSRLARITHTKTVVSKEKKMEIKLTFCPKVRFKRLLLFKVLKYFDHTVAFPGGIPVKIVYTHCKMKFITGI